MPYRGEPRHGIFLNAFILCINGAVCYTSLLLKIILMYAIIIFGTRQT